MLETYGERLTIRELLGGERGGDGTGGWKPAAEGPACWTTGRAAPPHRGAAPHRPSADLGRVARGGSAVFGQESRSIGFLTLPRSVRGRTRLAPAMPSPNGAFPELILDPDFWRPRLSRLGQVPRSLLVFPRPDLSRPGVEVIELRLRAHDGARIVCILGRPAFAARGDCVQVRLADSLAATELDWHAIEEGATDLIFAFPPERHLEDRVLDVLRVAQSAASIECAEWTDVVLVPEREAPCDAQRLAQMLREKGWV